MRVLLITSTRKDLVNVWVCQETSPAGSLLPPVDLASLAAVVRAQGHEASICDLRLARSPARAYRSALERFRPDAVVLNLATTGAEDDFALIKTTPDSIKRVCFGTHAQSLPQEVFAEGFDYILLGDPEAGLVNLLTHALDGQAAEGVLTPDRLTQKAALWEDLDTMPFPALDLLDLGRYRSSMVRRGKRFTLLMGSRGCPYSCTYCLYPVLLGSDSRLRSVKSICDEIEEDVRSHGIRSFYFLDATFNIKIGRAEAFAEELLSRNLKIDWSCNMRVAPVSREMLRLLKRSGCDWILYGVEDQDFLVETKKATTKDATLEAFRLTREAGISTIAFTMIFARPGLSEQRYAREMLRVLRLLEADAFQCNIAIPFPGTEMYQIEEAKGSPSRRWSLYDPHGAQLPYETEIDLVDVKRRIYRGFLLSHPLRTLRIASRMDLRVLSATAVSFARENLLAAGKKARSGRDRRSVRGLQPAGSSA